MKKNYASLKQYLFALTLLLATTIIIYSCKKDFKEAKQMQQLELSALQNWYDLNSVQDSSNRFKTMTPNWGHILINDQADQIVYEIALNNPEHIFQAKTILKGGTEKSFQKKNDIRLLLFQNKKTKVIQYGAYLSIINEGSNTIPLRYKSYQKLTGLVLFYSVAGSLANGWLYRNGEVVNSITLSNQSDAINANLDRLARGGIANFGREKIQKESSDPCLTGIPDYGISCVGTDGYNELQLLHYRLHIRGYVYRRR